MKSVRYKTANSLSDLIIGIGVILVIIPIVTTTINISQNGFNLVSLSVPFISFGIGLVVITFGQSIKAVLDTANNSFEIADTTKQILSELQTKKD